MEKNHKPSVYLFTGNHTDPSGVQDFIVSISSIFKSGKVFDFYTGPKFELGHDIYLYIEEFSKHTTRVKLREARKKVTAPFILIPTEFITQHKVQCTFNDFEYSNKVSPSILLRPLSRLYCKDICKKLLLEILFAVQYSPVFIYWLLKSLVKNGVLQTYLDIRKRFYMDVRYISYLSILDIFDYMWPPHNNIRLQNSDYFKIKKILPVITPLITSKIHIPSMSDSFSTIKIKMSGTLTQYRLCKLKEFKAWFKSFKKQSLCVNLTDFTNETENKHQMDFTLNPPQTRLWQYSSPMRLFRSLEIERCIPIITKNFQQSEIESLALNIENISKNGSNFNLIERFIEEFPTILNDYNSIAVNSANETVELLQSALK